MTSDDQPRTHFRWSRRLWIGYWIVLFIATHVPRPPGVPFRVKHSDKLIHFLMYFGLALLGGRCLRASRWLGRPRGLQPAVRATPVAALLGWAAVYAAYGAVDEWLQQFVAGRYADPGDWIANILGVVVATLVLLRSRGKP